MCNHNITVLSAVAEIERENILVQTMEGRKQKAREGKWNGGVAPFGYRLDKDKGILAVDPGESEIVKVIFDLFAHTNMGGDSIAEYLNSHGYVKNCSRDFELGYFSRKLILKILDNPVYIGKIAYGRTTTEKVKGKRGEYRILLDFDMIYSKMSDFDKKMFFRNLIKSIEINPDYEDKDRILKHIDFNFPVCFDAKEDEKLLFKWNDVETCVLLVRES